jgi:hypothetical protein
MNMLGQIRQQQACRAAADMPKGTIVTLLKRPRFGVRPIRRNKERVHGVTTHDVIKGSIVWVTFFGPGSARIA